MKFLSRAIERFCLKHRNFGIPKMMLGIVLITGFIGIVFSYEIYPYLVFSAEAILRGQIWRLITWIFLMGSSSGLGIIFLIIALYFYYFIGSTLEREWGKAKFTIYYLIGMMLHIIYGFALYFIKGSWVFLDPVYLNLSMFFAFAVLFPDFTVRLFFIIPIKIKWLALLNAGFFVIQILQNIFSGNYFIALLPVVALLNFILVCGDELLVYITNFTHTVRRQASPRVINFKKEAKKAKRDIDGKPYRHICAVCGKTDTEFPGEEFRYCSRCNGYYCFCSEHINNHIHFR